MFSLSVVERTEIFYFVFLNKNQPSVKGWFLVWKSLVFIYAKTKISPLRRVCIGIIIANLDELFIDSMVAGIKTMSTLNLRWNKFYMEWFGRRVEQKTFS